MPIEIDVVDPAKFNAWVGAHGGKLGAAPTSSGAGGGGTGPAPAPANTTASTTGAKISSRG
jgi:hypothetical protein